MKRILIFLFLGSTLFGQWANYPIGIQINPQVIKSDRVRVEVKIQNNTNYTIEKLEGFIFELGMNRKTITEKRLIIIGLVNPALQPGFTAQEHSVFAHDPNQFREYVFQVSRMKFSGDHRIYTYHPKTGFMRVD